MEVPLGDRLGARPLLRRESNTPWRLIAWGAVALVHLLFIAIFLVSEKPPRLHRALTPMEAELLLTPAQRAHAPNVQLIRPLAPDEAPPEIVTAPITLPPPPPTASEVMQSIGESMACGAGTYETLTAADRAHCRHTPWHGKRIANGTMVLDVVKPPPPTTDLHLTGGDVLRRQSQTANPCPILSVTPCIHKELYGDGPQ
jgi:hypothetical protein